MALRVKPSSKLTSMVIGEEVFLPLDISNELRDKSVDHYT